MAGSPTDLNNGSIGSTTIVTGTKTSAIAVPTSAITTVGSLHTVQVLKAGKATTVRVQIGVVGATWTEITNGVSVGDEVVLADLGAALPNSATDVSKTTATRLSTTFAGGPPVGAPGGGPGRP